MLSHLLQTVFEYCMSIWSGNITIVDIEIGDLFYLSTHKPHLVHIMFLFN